MQIVLEQLSSAGSSPQNGIFHVSQFPPEDKDADRQGSKASNSKGNAKLLFQTVSSGKCTGVLSGSVARVLLAALQAGMCEPRGIAENHHSSSQMNSASSIHYLLVPTMCMLLS